MRAAIPPLPNTPPWGGARLKKAQQGQIYLYLTLLKHHVMKTGGVEVYSAHSYPQHQKKLRCQLHAPTALTSAH